MRPPVVALGEHAMQRLLLDLGDGVPQRHLDGADGDRALAVAAGFLALQHAGEQLLGREILSPVVEQRVRCSRQDARNEPRPHRRPTGIAAGGVEGEANDPAAVAHHIGDHHHHRGGHLGEIEARIGKLRIKRDRGFADVDDAHPTD
jgi:hypothetical protein